MADLPIPKKGQKAQQPHPMQEHLDAIKDSHGKMEQFFRDQMEQQFKVDAEQERKAAKPESGASPLGGQAK